MNGWKENRKEDYWKENHKKQQETIEESCKETYQEERNQVKKEEITL